MANIINIEKSKYINSNIEIYAANKVGQYSKFLDKNVLFATYFHINVPMSKTDVGTGGVQSMLGPSSPIRYNKINNLPVYNVPELKPDLSYDENGYDIDLDLSGMTLLPGTIKPMSGDYLLLKIPGAKEYLFQINNFSYNTIQSNDFYLIDVSLKGIGDNLESKILPQVVESYETIFENIGTEDKCFIRSDNVPKIEAIGKLFLEMRDFYKNIFFDPQIGSFILKNNPADSTTWYYDMYVEKFIMNSKIYYTNNDAKSIMLACNDSENQQTDIMYTRTLLYAVLNRNGAYLNDNTYYYQRKISKRLSPFVLYNSPTNGTAIMIQSKPFLAENPNIVNWYIDEYYSRALVLAIKYPNGIYPDDETQTPQTFVPTNYLEEVIYNYMLNKMQDIDKNKLIEYMVANDLQSYTYLPIILYIILQYYNSYFEKFEL